MPGSGVTSWLGPDCCKTLLLRAWFKRADRRKWSAAYSNRITSLKGRSWQGYPMVRAFLGNCAEVTHCISNCMLVASEPVQVGGFGKDEPVAGVFFGPIDFWCQWRLAMADVPPQRITDLETATRQRRQLSCILDSCTIAASYEVNQAQKALLLMPRTAKGASTSSGELNAQGVTANRWLNNHAFHDSKPSPHHPNPPKNTASQGRIALPQG